MYVCMYACMHVYTHTHTHTQEAGGQGELAVGATRRDGIHRQAAEHLAAPADAV